MALRFLLGAALVLAGCGGEDSEVQCGPDEVKGACVPPGPELPCPPGEWLRGTECIAAGIPLDGCGEGFVHDMDRGCEAILPPDDCPDGFMAVPGETRCHEVAPCASGVFGDIPVEPDTEYVDASFAGVSDGSQAAPWKTIQEGIDAALPDAMVAVAAGSYLEDVRVDGKAVRLWGKCPALVEVRGTGFAALLIGIGASGTEVRHLSIRGGGAGVAISGAEDVLVEELWVHDNANRGVFAQNDYGPASVTVRGSLVARNGLSGVLAGGSGMTIEATMVRDNLPDAEGYRGRGIVAQVFEPTGARANVSIVRSLVQGNRVDGIWITGAEVMVEATVVRDTLTDVDNVAGRGILAQDNEVTGARAEVTVARSLIERNHDAGVAIMGSTLSVEATVVRTTLESASEFAMGGILVVSNPVTASRASLAVARCLLERNPDFGIGVDGSDATVEATAIRDPAVEQGGFGRAIQIQRDSNTGASASGILHANLFERSVRSGVGVMGPATAELDACLVVDTAAADGDYLGDGLTVWSYDGPASATLTATRIERSHRAAVSSFGGTVAIEASQFVCQAFDLAAESLDGVAAVYDDRGGVLCGCPEATESCKAQSYALEPPTLE